MLRNAGSVRIKGGNPPQATAYTSGQLAKGVRVEVKMAPNRGVFKKPKAEAARQTVPNSVFALGQSVLGRA